MTSNLSIAKNLSPSTENECSVFTDRLKDPKNWTMPVHAHGIDGIEIVDKRYTLWEELKSYNNFGRAEGLDQEQVLMLVDDIRYNGVDVGCQPVYVDADTGEVITGAHRYASCVELNILGYMVVFVKCRDEWARERFSKILNNQRLFHAKLNGTKDIINHIKSGIGKGELEEEKEIVDEIFLMSNHSLTQAQRNSILKEIMSYISTNGIKTVKREQYCTHSNNTFLEYVHRSTDSYKKDVINNPKHRTLYYNVTSGTSPWSILTEMAKCRSDEVLSLQFSVGLPSKDNSLNDKRNNFIKVTLEEVYEVYSKIGNYLCANRCFPTQHTDAKHAAMAQDHINEDVDGGQFIRF